MTGPPASANAQTTRILRVLIEAKGEWVPSPVIAALAQQYNSRIKELRGRGFCIENKIRTDDTTGERRSWFRLVRQSPPPPTPDRDPYPPRATGLPLFDAAVSK